MDKEDVLTKVANEVENVKLQIDISLPVGELSEYFRTWFNNEIKTANQMLESIKVTTAATVRAAGALKEEDLHNLKYRRIDEKRKCELCGNEFIPAKSGITQRFCSDYCRVKANRIKNRQMIRKQP